MRVLILCICPRRASVPFLQTLFVGPSVVLLAIGKTLHPPLDTRIARVSVARA